MSSVQLSWDPFSRYTPYRTITLRRKDCCYCDLVPSNIELILRVPASLPTLSSEWANPSWLWHDLLSWMRRIFCRIFHHLPQSVEVSIMQLHWLSVHSLRTGWFASATLLALHLSVAMSNCRHNVVEHILLEEELVAIYHCISRTIPTISVYAIGVYLVVNNITMMSCHRLPAVAPPRRPAPQK